MKIYKHNNLYKQRGISLLEVLITLVIIAIGVVGLTATQGVSIKETGNAAQRTSAILMANELIERMHNNRMALAEYKTAIDAGCGALPAVCVTGYYAKNKTAAPIAIASGGTCNTNAAAAFDVYDTVCSLGNKDGVNGKSSNRDYLLDAKVSMKCFDTAGAYNATCSDVEDTVELVVKWQTTDDALKKVPVASATPAESAAAKPKYYEDKVVVRSVL